MGKRVNQFFSFFARQYYGVYIWVGVIASASALLSVDFELATQFLAEFKKLFTYLLFLIWGSYIIVVIAFYSEELPKQEAFKVRHHVVIVKDLYFQKKIETDIKLSTKILGYLYVILRVLHASTYGVVVGLLFFILISAIKERLL